MKCVVPKDGLRLLVISGMVVCINAASCNNRSALEGDQARYAALEARSRTAQTECDQRVQRLTNTLDEERTGCAAALAAARTRDAQAQARLATFRGMIQRFRSMIDAGQLSVRVIRNRMVLVLPEGVLFGTGSAEIHQAGRHVLTELSGGLRDVARDFQVAGHTDNVPIHTPQFASNWELSTARADNVVHFLLDEHMPVARLSAAGYADTQPVESNDTPVGRQQNRRIEIVLEPNLDELPDLSALQNLHDGAATPAH